MLINETGAPLPTGAKQRSPNYPSISLEEAIQRVRKIYDSEHTHPASREVVARDLGYNTLNGASLPLIGSLKRYGLLEDSGEGLRVTDDAVAILELPDRDKERAAALHRVAFAPTFFVEIRQEFGEKLPSDANLRHYLIKRKFLPRAADELIRVYRDNMKLLDLAPVEYNRDMAHVNSEITHTVESPQPFTSRMLPQSAASLPDSCRQDIFSLSEGHVTIQWPNSLSQESFEDLSAWLDIVKRKIGRSVTRGGGTASDN